MYTNMYHYVSLTLMIIVSTLADLENPVVHTPAGSIEGLWRVSRNGRPYQAYEGIPYAQPPIGDLRFEPPQPLPPWEGVLPAKFDPSACIQYAQETVDTESHVEGSEDCLYLQVYTSIGNLSDRNHTELLPVIIFFYGAGFQMGKSFMWKPYGLMDKDIVFVTMNHRVGPLGFLSTEDEVVPGNMGLKDQALAIKWVSLNIASFGGDPNQVTLTGMSSGGACVQYHYLSPMSRGLFHRGISASGTVFNPWAQTEASLEKAKKLGSLMGCPTISNKEMIQCLKTRPAKTILEFARYCMGYLYNPFVPFGPVVESRSMDPFIHKSPTDIINSGESADLPLIMSDDTEEGVYPSTEFLVNETIAKYVDENWEALAPHILDFNYTIPASQHANVSRYIRNHYMGDKRIERSNSIDVIRMIGDRLYAKSTSEGAKKQAQLYNSPIWFYIYGYRGEYSISDVFTVKPENFGVGHTDEAYIIFDMVDTRLHKDEDIRMSQEFTNMWYSFAVTGVPDMGVEWAPINRSIDELNYLRISAPGNYSMESIDNFADYKFWNTIDFNENKPTMEFKANTIEEYIL